MTTTLKTMLARLPTGRRKRVQERAKELIRDNGGVTLSSSDWDILYKALLNPESPNTELRKAFAKYKKAT